MKGKLTSRANALVSRLQNVQSVSLFAPGRQSRDSGSVPLKSAEGFAVEYIRPQAKLPQLATDTPSGDLFYSACLRFKLELPSKAVSPFPSETLARRRPSVLFLSPKAHNVTKRVNLLALLLDHLDGLLSARMPPRLSPAHLPREAPLEMEAQRSKKAIGSCSVDFVERMKRVASLVVAHPFFN